MKIFLMLADWDWSSMSQGGVVNTIVGILMCLMVWLLKSYKENNADLLKSLKSEGEEDRKLIREECALVRKDHREDMNSLFQDAKLDRHVTQEGFKELTAVIRDLKNEIHSRGKD